MDHTEDEKPAETPPAAPEHHNTDQHWPSHPAPAPQLAAPAPPPAPASFEENTSGVLVLQWLTYAFWGWTVLAMSILTATVISSFIDKSSSNGFTPYGIAAVLVLLPIAAGCDFFYSKHEPSKKTGASALVMIIHAVIFALFGIGSLIVAVFSLISMFTSSSDTSGAQIGLYSAIVIFILYALTFLRTLNPGGRMSQLRRFYMVFMVIAVGIIGLLGLLGPVANAHKTRNDKLIESNLNDIEQGIDDYARVNKKLPNSLDAVDYKGDSAKLLDTRLVEYKASTLPASSIPSPTSYSRTTALNKTAAAALPQDVTFYYQLCVTYKEASSDGYSSYNSPSRQTDDYTTDVSPYDHPAGHICYKIKTTNYGDGNY